MALDSRKVPLPLDEGEGLRDLYVQSYTKVLLQVLGLACRKRRKRPAKLMKKEKRCGTCAGTCSKPVEH